MILTKLKAAANWLKELEPPRKYMIGAFCALLILELLLYSGVLSPKDQDSMVGAGSPKTAADEVLFGDKTPVSNDYEIPENAESNQEAEATEETVQTPAEEPEPPLTAEQVKEQGFLVLVNKTHPVSEDYKPDDLTAIKYYAEDRSAEGRYLRAEAADQFHKMIEAAQAEGYTIVMTTAYRSYGFQKILWDNYVANEGEAAAARYSAKPGQSEHQTGLAVDVSSPSVDYKLTDAFGSTEEGLWLQENAHRFGFILRYPKGMESTTGYMHEAWHFRYVGTEAADVIHENGLTLEEYLIETE